MPNPEDFDTRRAVEDLVSNVSLHIAKYGKTPRIISTKARGVGDNHSQELIVRLAIDTLQDSPVSNAYQMMNILRAAYPNDLHEHDETMNNLVCTTITLEPGNLEGLPEPAPPTKQDVGYKPRDCEYLFRWTLSNDNLWVVQLRCQDSLFGYAWRDRAGLWSYHIYPPHAETGANYYGRSSQENAIAEMRELAGKRTEYLFAEKVLEKPHPEVEWRRHKPVKDMLTNLYMAGDWGTITGHLKCRSNEKFAEILSDNEVILYKVRIPNCHEEQSRIYCASLEESMNIAMKHARRLVEGFNESDTERLNIVQRFTQAFKS